MKQLEAGENPHIYMRNKFPEYSYIDTSESISFITKVAERYRIHMIVKHFNGTYYLFAVRRSS